MSINQTNIILNNNETIIYNNETINNCYCDPIFNVNICDENFCRTYTFVFFILFLIILLESVRRTYLYKLNIKSAAFISLCQISFSSLFMFIKFVITVAKIQDIQAHRWLFMWHVAFLISSFMWVLIVWCDVLSKIKIAPDFAVYLPYLKKIIMVTNLFSVFVFGFIFPVYYNTLAILIVLVIIILFIFLNYLLIGLNVWKEYKVIKELSPNVQIFSKETKRKVKRISIFSGATNIAVIVTIVILWASYKDYSINSNIDEKTFMILNRLISAFFICCLIITFKPNQSNKFSKKNKFIKNNGNNKI